MQSVLSQRCAKSLNGRPAALMPPSGPTPLYMSRLTSESGSSGASVTEQVPQLRGHIPSTGSLRLRRKCSSRRGNISGTLRKLGFESIEQTDHSAVELLE